ncbi:hypothetical protein [Glaciibacter sp. 2TAF33]|uniref:hypothetical protein n=1 Tax=Glaciibacter sp. 2TAF33 TaxID=3233015 RepID=UPI003F8F1C06
MADRYRSGDQGHIAAVGMTTSCQEGFLGDDNVGTDMNLILIVEPDTFADPRSVADMEFPRKLDASSRAEHYLATNLSAKEAKDAYAEARADLPGVCYKDQLDYRPQKDKKPWTVPRSALAWCVRQVDDWDFPGQWRLLVVH